MDGNRQEQLYTSENRFSLPIRLFPVPFNTEINRFGQYLSLLFACIQAKSSSLRLCPLLEMGEHEVDLAIAILIAQRGFDCFDRTEIELSDPIFKGANPFIGQ